MTDALAALCDAIDQVLDFNHGLQKPAQILAALRERGFDVVQTSTLVATSHCLRSYQYGNAATDPAKDMADLIDQVIGGGK